MIIRDIRPDEHDEVGELRVAAYRALGLLAEGGGGYAQTLRGLGFGGDCAVLVAASEADDAILGTIMLEPFEPGSELARDDTEADIRAFAVAPQAQGQGVGRLLLRAVIERAEKRGVRTLRLCTRPEMRAAQHLYETTGFARTPELDFEPLPGLTLRAYEIALPLRSLASPSRREQRWLVDRPQPAAVRLAARHRRIAARPDTAPPPGTARVASGSYRATTPPTSPAFALARKKSPRSSGRPARS